VAMKLGKPLSTLAPD